MTPKISKRISAHESNGAKLTDSFPFSDFKSAGGMTKPSSRLQKCSIWSRDGATKHTNRFIIHVAAVHCRWYSFFLDKRPFAVRFSLVP